MRNRMWIVAVALFAVAAAWSVSAFAADAAAGGGNVNAWQGFWNSVGGFLYNAMPWNWGNWMGK